MMITVSSENAVFILLLKAKAGGLKGIRRGEGM